MYIILIPDGGSTPTHLPFRNMYSMQQLVTGISIYCHVFLMTFSSKQSAGMREPALEGRLSRRFRGIFLRDTYP